MDSYYLFPKISDSVSMSLGVGILNSLNVDVGSVDYGIIKPSIIRYQKHWLAFLQTSNSYMAYAQFFEFVLKQTIANLDKKF